MDREIDRPPVDRPQVPRPPTKEELEQLSEGQTFIHDDWTGTGPKPGEGTGETKP